MKNRANEHADTRHSLRLLLLFLLLFLFIASLVFLFFFCFFFQIFFFSFSHHRISIRFNSIQIMPNNWLRIDFDIAKK